MGYSSCFQVTRRLGTEKNKFYERERQRTLQKKDDTGAQSTKQPELLLVSQGKGWGQTIHSLVPPSEWCCKLSSLKIVLLVKKMPTLGMVARTFNPNTLEAVTDGSL